MILILFVICNLKFVIDFMLETERLILRKLAKWDADAVFAMRSDREVMRFIREPQTRRETDNWIKMISSRWQDEKIGFCAVIEKSSNEFIGWCGLWRLRETAEIEIGYAIAKDFRQKGFAAEAAARFLRYGFEDLKLDKVVAVARPENTASRRVMEKLGMKFDGIGKFYERDLAHYSITKNEFNG
ncbi:MAG: GNAT family N-acetyltransferase [Pyrinomonadaceae bacterium]